MTILTDFFDALRALMPFSLACIIPLLIIISPIDPAQAAHHFTAYRLQQFDIQNARVGSRSSAVNFEAHTRAAKLLSRKCLILRLFEATLSAIRAAVKQNVGAILVLLPQDLDGMTQRERAHLLQLERDLLDHSSEEISPGVFFAFEQENSSTARIYRSVSALDQSFYSTSSSSAGGAVGGPARRSSAAAELFNSIWTHGYQLFASSSSASASSSGSASSSSTYNHPLSDFQISNFYGRLVGNGIEEQMPSVLIVSHYDALGGAPSLSTGYDSNASGVSAMLELMKTLAKLYKSFHTHARFNLAFLLSGGGKFNYIGTKRWLEEFPEIVSKASDSSRAAGGGSSFGHNFLESVSLVICLEGLAFDSTNQIYVHVSKPPRPGSLGHKFLLQLRQSAAAAKHEHEQEHKHEHDNSNSSTSRVHLVHKKINLNDDNLAWEHERFSLKKLPGMTLSSWPSHVAAQHRFSMTDRNGSLPGLTWRTRVIAEAVIRTVFNVDLPASSSGSPVLSAASNSSTDREAEQLEKQPDPANSSANTNASFSSPLDTFVEANGAHVITQRSVKFHLDQLTAWPRSQQLLPKNHPLLGLLFSKMRAYLHSSSAIGGSAGGGVGGGATAGVSGGVRTHYVAADPKDPEFTFYAAAQLDISAHKVKPTAFDFIVACGVAAYLFLVFMFVENFQTICKYAIPRLLGGNSLAASKDKIQ